MRSKYNQSFRLNALATTGKLNFEQVHFDFGQVKIISELTCQAGQV